MERYRAVLMVFALVLSGCVGRTIAQLEDYSKARQQDTVEALEDFLEEHPTGRYADRARTEMAALETKDAFLEAEHQNTGEAYAEFLARHPRSHFEEIARVRLEEYEASEEAAFATSCRIGSARALSGFLDSYPESKYAAWTLDRIAYLDAVKSEGLDGFRKFVAEAPTNAFVPEAISRYPVLWLTHVAERQGPSTFLVVGSPLLPPEENDRRTGELIDALASSGLRPVRIGTSPPPVPERGRVVVQLHEDLERHRVLRPLWQSLLKTVAQSATAYGVLGSRGAEQVMYQELSGNKGGDFQTEIVPVVSQSIWRIGDERFCYLGLESLTERAEYSESVRALRPFGVAALPSLVFAASGSHHEARIRAIPMLGELDDPRTIPPLFRALEDVSPLIRRLGVEALAGKRGHTVRERLEVHAHDPDEEVRAAVVRALERTRAKP